MPTAMVPGMAVPAFPAMSWAPATNAGPETASIQKEQGEAEKKKAQEDAQAKRKAEQ